jgi:hypothetical protein
MAENKNIIYILTNEAMPGIVKIGKTNVDIETRMRRLYRTGVPVPFNCFHASIVKNANNVEKRLHNAFDKYRINKNREFFEIPPENILEILEMIEIKNVTPNEDIVETEEDKIAIDKLEKKKDRFSFKMVDIPIGAILNFEKNEEKTCEVIDNNRVKYKDKIMSLSAAALKALKEVGYNWKSAQGAAHWLYKGKTLKERREEFELK